MPLISVSVKHGKAVVQLEMESALTILNAMEEVEQQTGVPVRSQKLIQAGKVLDPKLTLEQCKVKPGAKWMLMAAAQGQTQVSLAAGVEPLAGAVSSMSCPPAAAGSGCSSASCPGEGCTGTGGGQRSGVASRGVGLGHPQALLQPQPQCWSVWFWQQQPSAIVAVSLTACTGLGYHILTTQAASSYTVGGVDRGE